MTEPLRDWLPVQAAEQAAVRLRIEETVAAWSAHWLGGQGLRLSAWGTAAAAAAGVGGEGSWRDCGPFQADCPPRAAVRLGGLALGLRMEDVDLSDRDHRLLTALSRRMVDDLAARLRRLLDVPGGAVEVAAEPRVAARLSDGDDVLLSVAIPFPLLIKLCRQTLPRPRASTAALQSRRAAAGPACVRLTATLGSTSLGLNEARDLAVGDVLVLERALHEAIDLSVAGVAVGRGVLTELDGHAALILQTSE